MKVAVWGPYNHGNFGDSIMGLMVARRLLACGAEPWLYRYDPETAARHGFRSSSSLDEVFRDAAFGVFGGGTLLLEPLVGTPAEAFEQDLRDLLAVLQATGCPFYCLNGGGDGTPASARRLSPTQWELLRGHVRGATVRTGVDRDLLAGLGVEAQLHPDMVLALRPAPPSGVRNRSAARPLHAGVCVGGRLAPLWFWNALTRWAGIHRGTVYHLFTPHHHSTHALPPPGSCWRTHTFRDPAETASFIASLDLLVSNYMHPLVAALSSGVPVVCLDRRPKSVAVLRGLGLDFACRDRSIRSLAPLLPVLGTCTALRAYGRRFDGTLLEDASTQAEGHLRALDRWVERHAMGRA